MTASEPAATRGREHNKLVTRRALRSAVLDLGLERGWERVRIEEVTARAGVSPRTFFNYFETKEDAALLGVLALTREELAAVARSTGPDSVVWGELTTLFATEADRVGREGPEFSRRMELHRRSPALQSRQMGEFARFEARLSAAVASRLPDDDSGHLRARMMSGSCITAVRVGLETWARGAWRGSPEPHVRSAFAVLDVAFGPSGG